jgi:hypothetical protein
MHRDSGLPGPSLLGFDFPIGVPAAYAKLAGIENFASLQRDRSRSKQYVVELASVVRRSWL